MKDQIKVGLIGLGSIAESSHIVHVHASSRAVLAAVVDLDEKRAKTIAEKYGVKNYFQTVEEMLEKVELDAVMICTPNSTHIPIAMKCAEKGIHVFMEKPIGTDLEEVKAYLQLAEERQVMTMVGMTHRFRRDVQILKAYADKGDFGHLYFVKAKLFRRRGTPKGWFTDQSLSGGGAMLDIGVHVLDLAWWLMGSPQVQSISGKTVSGLGNYDTKYTSSWESSNRQLNKQNVFDVEDFGSAWIRFKNGVVLSLDIAWAVNGEEDDGIKIELLGDKGGATLSPFTIFTEMDGLLSRQHPIYEDHSPFKDEIDHFIECVRTGSKPMIDGEDGYEVLKLLKGIYNSSKQDQEIHFK
ncbi:Gfo/Idh/MocA family oxidoreductase [Rossellomorea vietnamensis]|uniref:Gfo/Idh/MocA family oxidoreductase n=1 Tax=Rossellomorea vietnamensis TaxID=218284 RepID=A0A6I6UJX9_9BACI|nr:Gfo/Idh/MocA family oxidoreductase [Rossellomorea vietnamensis]QHE63284.1 Gfo/Idh/MocA family oxidoreductase [Rossellomorea vietnamensis]